MPARVLKRVLVVDDDDGIRRMISAALVLKDLAVDGARDGREAIDLLAENDYSVVILDLLMPVVDGFVVLESIRRRGLPSSPVVLVVTGADRSVVDGLDASAIHGIIRKPFDPDELAAVVAACAEIKSRRAFETMAMAMVASGSLLVLLN